MLRMEHDFRASHDGPPHGFGVAPALVADRDAELHAVDLENAPAAAGHIEPVFTGIQLVLGRWTFSSPSSREIAIEGEARPITMVGIPIAL